LKLSICSAHFIACERAGFDVVQEPARIFLFPQNLGNITFQ